MDIVRIPSNESTLASAPRRARRWILVTILAVVQLAGCAGTSRNSDPGWQYDAGARRYVRTGSASPAGRSAQSAAPRRGRSRAPDERESGSVVGKVAAGVGMFAGAVAAGAAYGGFMLLLLL